jgi:hypothetical protein
MTTYGKLKGEGAAANVGAPPDKLLLAGDPADEAVTCMRNEGIMPAQPTLSNSKPDVEVSPDGRVSVEEYGTDKDGHYTRVMTEIKPAQDGNPAKASTSQVVVTGSLAETMRQKARACAFNSIHLKP